MLGQNSYDYVKPHLLRAMVGKILGYGLLLSEGDVHKACLSILHETQTDFSDAKEEPDASVQLPSHQGTLSRLLE